jgi:hypothetical protein
MQVGGTSAAPAVWKVLGFPPRRKRLPELIHRAEHVEDPHRDPSRGTDGLCSHRIITPLEASQFLELTFLTLGAALWLLWGPTGNESPATARVSLAVVLISFSLAMLAFAGTLDARGRVGNREGWLLPFPLHVTLAGLQGLLLIAVAFLLLLARPGHQSIIAQLGLVSTTANEAAIFVCALWNLPRCIRGVWCAL